MSIAHPSGNDLESMSEFYNNFFLRAVTLLSALNNIFKFEFGFLGLSIIFYFKDPTINYQ